MNNSGRQGEGRKHSLMENKSRQKRQRNGEEKIARRRADSFGHKSETGRRNIW